MTQAILDFFGSDLLDMDATVPAPVDTAPLVAPVYTPAEARRVTNFLLDIAEASRIEDNR